MLFNIYTTKVTIENEEYELRPLSGRYIGKLYSVLGAFQGGSEEDVLNKLDEETVGNLYDIVFETFKQSYPDQDEKALSAFVSQNLMKLIEPIVKVNMGKTDKQK